MNQPYDIAVIGAGPGGYVAALKAAQLGARTAVIEDGHLGGTCLNNGCIPSKALLASAEALRNIRDASSLGIAVCGEVTFDWPAIQKRKDGVLAKLRTGVSGLLAAGKVKLVKGRATLAGPGAIEVTSPEGRREELKAKKIVIATGSVPARIPGWPEDAERVATSDEALHWKSLPESLVIVGGGVIGCEFACMMHEYGVRVTVVEMMDGLLPEMDASLGAGLARAFTSRGIEVLTGAKVERLDLLEGGVRLALEGGRELSAEKALVATGRRPNTAGIGLESVGIETDRGFVRVDDRMRSKAEGVYCIGDANGRALLAHAASAQAVTAIEDALGHTERAAHAAQPVPSAVYTFPEVASVGMTTRQAMQDRVPVAIGQFQFAHLGKAMATGHETGFVRVIRGREDDALLGVHVLGHNATEIIHTAAAMIGFRARASDLGEMIFAHPTLGEAVKEAAEDALRQAIHAPPRRTVNVTAGVLQ